MSFNRFEFNFVSIAATFFDRSTEVCRELAILQREDPRLRVGFRSSLHSRFRARQQGRAN